MQGPQAKSSSKTVIFTDLPRIAPAGMERHLTLIRYLTLSETEYKEVHVKKIEPDWDPNLKGTHTFNFDDDFTVIDAYSMRRRPLLN